MTAFSTLSFKNLEASAVNLRSTWELISSGANSLPAWLEKIFTFLSEPSTTLYGTCLVSSPTSPALRPMKRLTEKKVFSGFTTAWRLAICPTRRSPPLVKATTEGVVRLPSALAMIVGLPPSIAATAELVVPKSMPTTFSARTATAPRLDMGILLPATCLLATGVPFIVCLKLVFNILSVCARYCCMCVATELLVNSSRS
mmetsp:Transcript_4580/g.12509  ORF Transcript_4580/g.12509 Transcript_4580/m.12509 type:complete len:200 (-) Transcript_4580:46-645(-)